ncbi:hypothetical protein [Thioclava sp. DLFJ5-1]|uniref:hypothetical protein n=1 Tax=Thioclava sp. DLFJ5-1 TaxID=1915314 RepID=UPI0011814DC3|nr:hypothetical protein [Thioclava sp. DLFJ5-1]
MKNAIPDLKKYFQNPDFSGGKAIVKAACTPPDGMPEASRQTSLPLRDSFPQLRASGGTLNRSKRKESVSEHLTQPLY